MRIREALLDVLKGLLKTTPREEPLADTSVTEEGRSRTQRPGTMRQPWEESPLEMLRAYDALHIVVLRLVDHALLHELYGSELLSGVERSIAASIGEHLPQLGHLPDGTLQLFPAEGGEFVAVWPAQRQRTRRLADIAYTLKHSVRHAVKDSPLLWSGRDLQIDTGCAVFRKRPDRPVEDDFLRSLDDARMMAHRNMDLTDLRMARDFKTILQENALRTLYQPIVHFPTGRIMAWEALTRGPADSPLHSPAMLFDVAEEMGMLFALERNCREHAIADAGTLAAGQKLFLNIHPRTLSDPEFTPGSTLRALRDTGLRPEDVVFEITERHAIKDLTTFYKTLEHYREQGFGIAIDDAGTGYSGLASIAELKPDFIKIDMSLVRGIHRDPVRQALIETFIDFAEKIGARVIAEGIECREEASILLRMGAHYGQGYYLGRPSYPKHEEYIDLSGLRPALDIGTSGMACSMPVGDLAEEAQTVAPDALVDDIRKRFEDGQQHNGLAVVDANTHPMGLVMDYHLNRQLSAQYGVALYSRRAVTCVMDPAPTILDESTPAEEAARIAMARPRLQAYDDLLVTREGRLTGIVPVQKLLHTIAEVQVELAKGTNPLSGLPGNVAIEKEIETRLASARRFALIYADLDNFKSYNDTYGFKNGDRIILLLARILAWAIRRHGRKGDLVGHIGGDDFVCITTPELASRVCKGITRCFGRLVRHCYSAEDRERGWIMARGRDGVERNFPLVSVSLAVLDCGMENNLLEIGERAAHVKHLAKAIAGNAYVLETGNVGGSGDCVCRSGTQSAF